MSDLTPQKILDAFKESLEEAARLHAPDAKYMFIVGTHHERYQIRPSEARSDGPEAFRRFIEGALVSTVFF